MQSETQSEKRIGEIDSSTDFQVQPDKFTTLRFDVLAVLADGSRRGTAVKPPLDEMYEADKSLPVIYNALTWGEERDLVEIGEIDARTNEYAITNAGREALVGRIVQLCRLAGISPSDVPELEGSA